MLRRTLRRVRFALFALVTTAVIALAVLMGDGNLDPQIDLETSWTEAAAAIEALVDRRIAGKAVLLVGDG